MASVPRLGGSTLSSGQWLKRPEFLIIRGSGGSWTCATTSLALAVYLLASSKLTVASLPRVLLQSSVNSRSTMQHTACSFPAASRATQTRQGVLGQVPGSCRRGGRQRGDA